MPDLRARHEPPRARPVRLPDLRVPDAVRDASRADGVAASTALAVVGAALAWWLPGDGVLRTLGLALVVLGPLGLRTTLTLLPSADVSGLDDVDDVDGRLPELELRHSVRP